jgi:uncharacterized protein YbaR (Trm112 family)
MMRTQGSLIALCALLAACSPQRLLDMVASPADKTEALKYLDELRTGQLDELEPKLDPKVFQGDNHALLQKMQSAMPAGSPTSVTLIGVQYVTVNGEKRKNLTFEYNFSGQWRVANVAIQEHAGLESIIGMHVYVRSQSLDDEGRFRLAGKPPMQYLVLTLAVLLPLFSVYSLILCVRTKFAGRKWPWVLLTLVGVGRLTLNWNSGAWDMATMQVLLLSAGFYKNLYGPWMLNIAFPLGPLLFLWRRRALMAPTASAPNEPMMPTAP